MVGDAGWRQPLGVAASGEDSLLVTTDHGIVELDARRGTTFWVLRLSGCTGALLVLPDGSFLVLCRGVVLRCRDGNVEPLAGKFKGPTMLLAGPDGEPWVLSGTGPSFQTNVRTLALTRVGDRAGQQHRFDIDFDASVHAAGWWERRRFLLAASGHSAVVDLSRSGAVQDTDWITSSHHYAGHMLVIDPNTVITASPTGSSIEVALSFTTIAERSTDLVATLAINGISGFASTGEGRAYLLADVRGNDPTPAPILIRLSGLARREDEPARPRRTPRH